MDALFWLLLPVAAISGWIAATRHFKSLGNSKLPGGYAVSSPTDATHSKGRSNFIDTQPDKAVDIVIDNVEVNSDTVEVHLALGNLYRRSGEVNRAIRFHQNLSEKHSLSHSERGSILFELGRDYLSAGLLDRAERIFKDLLSTEGFKVKSSKALVEVYQQEKDWDEALEYAEMYEQLSKQSQKNRIAHYYCEKAEKLAADCEGGCDARCEEIRLLLRRALKKDRSCVRANILLGDMSLRSFEYGAALKYYMSAVEQDSAFLSVVFENLIRCMQIVENSEKSASLSLELPSGERIKGSEFSVFVQPEPGLKHVQAMKYIERQLDKAPTLSLLGKYLLLSLEDPELLDRKAASHLKDALHKISQSNASYKCVSCGLGVHALHWQCPSCLNWSTIKPL